MKNMKSIITQDVNNRNDKTFDYHDLAVVTYKYCDELAKDIGIVVKYKSFIILILLNFLTANFN